MIWFKVPQNLMLEQEYKGIPLGRSRGWYYLKPEVKVWLLEHAPDYSFGQVASTYILGVQDESTAALLKLTWNLK